VANRVIGVVMTVRSGQAVPTQIADLYRDGHITRLELQHLARAEVDQLLESVLGGPVLTDSVDRLWALTDGNVLYLHELVLDAIDTGALKRSEGLWRWQGASPIGSRLGEVVGARLRSADLALQRFLAVIALGEPLAEDVACRLAPEADVIDIERRGLIKLDRSAPATRVRLAHPLYGEVIRAAISVADRRQLCSALADNVRGREDLTAAEVLQVAQWRLISGTAADAALLAEGAEEANRQGDPALALSLADASLAAQPTAAGLLQRAAALVALGDFEDAAVVLDGIGSWDLDDRARKGIAYQQLRALHFGLGRTDDALAALTETERAISDDRSRMAVQGWRAGILASAGRLQEAATVAEPLLGSADPRVRASALSVMAADRLRVGRPGESVRLAREARETERSKASASADLLLLVQESLGLMAAGEFKSAGDVVDRAWQSAVRSKSDANTGTALILRGRFELACGRPATAARLLRDGTTLTAGHDAGGYLAWGLALLAEAQAVLGDRAAAQAAAARSRDLPEAGTLLLRPDTRRSQMWADPRPASALADLARELLADGDIMVALHALHDAVRLGCGLNCCTTLSQLAAGIEGELASAIAVQADGLARGNAGQLESASNLYADMGTGLLAAEAMAQAGATAQKQGLRARAQATLRRASELAAACEGARTPALVSATKSPELTAREREIALLAARGMTNKEIAGQLSTSVRTVEGHLYQAFAKLGLASRRELNASMVDRLRE
jgi:ATP/maltotriose-dependent transcriptional regulator MalT